MNVRFKRTITDKAVAKGMLSEDCSYIIYTDEDDNEQVLRIQDLLNAFKNCEIELSVTLKSEEDLDVIPMDDEE